MNIFESITNKETTIVVIGLGYVGMPLAVAFAKKARVIGFDLNAEKVGLYKAGIDVTNEVGNDEIKDTNAEFTADESRIKEGKFFIVAVPTPINSDKTPNLSPVESASRIVGRNLSEGSIVVYESTVYPGVTEDICIPILEEESGLKCGIDFSVGYSPERINPGDKIHRLENIVKIVSGVDEATLEEIAKVYELIIDAQVYRASSIKVAEAAKVVENSQRDINIAFMNELAMVFDLMGIDTMEVVKAMNTKWNALGFTPGLVGGHCIGIDPYYFIYEAERLGYHSQIILGGRKINDGMASFITQAVIKQLILADKKVKGSVVAVFGVTFKEDIPDLRNSQVFEIIEELQAYGVQLLVVDSHADKKEVERDYGLQLTKPEDIKNIDCLLLAVPHKEFKELSLEQYDSMFKECEISEKVIIDVKSMLNKEIIKNCGYTYWSL